MPVEIIPSLLVNSEEEFKTQIESVGKSVKMIQIDLADGNFVPNTTWTYQFPKKAQKYLNIDFELHLMVIDPLKVLKDWGSHPKLRRILVHYESADDINLVIEKLKTFHKKIGIVLNPDTPIDALNPFLDKIDAVMFMGVNPGFQGQKFIPKTLERIKLFKEKGSKHFVEVDGAVNKSTIHDIAKAGADGVCPGSAIFGNNLNPAKNIKSLKKLAK